MPENWSVENFTQPTAKRWSVESFTTGKPGPLDPRSFTPDTYMQHAAERIQMYQTERREAGQAEMTANEQVAIQDAYRELAGLAPTTYRRYKGGAVTIDRFAEIRQARTEESGWENFKVNIANTVMQSAGGITAFGAKMSDTIGITDDAMEKWSNQLNETQRILAPRGGVSGLLGQVVGSTMFSLLAGGTGPAAGTQAWAHGLKVGGAFGLSAAGQTFAEVSQRRMEGQDIGVLNEWTAALGNGAIEAVTEAFGWTVASRFATKLVRGVPGLRNALATQGWKGAQGWLSRGLKTSAGAVLAQLPQGYLEEFTAQIGQDATNIMTGITPEVDWSDLLGRAHQAGKAGALQPLLLGGGMAAGRLMQQQLHQDTTGLGDPDTAPQEAGPGRSIDPGEAGPTIFTPEVTPAITPEVAPTEVTPEGIPSFEEWITDQGEVSPADLTTDPALEREYRQEYTRFVESFGEVTPTTTPEILPTEVTPAAVSEVVAPDTELRGRDRRGQMIKIERGEPVVLPTAEYIEQQRTARLEWGETPTQIDEALRLDAQRMIDHAEEFGGTAEDITLRKQRAQEVIDELGKPTTEAPSVVTREAVAETKLVKKSISLVQKKLGREGSKITDSKSLAEVGMAIAEIVGLDPEVDITWEFKTDPNLVGDAGVHLKLKDGTHKIVIRHGTKYVRGAVISPAIAKRRAQAGMKVGQITPSKTNLYRVIVHELGHIAAPPTRADLAVPRRIHHPEFVEWVKKSIPKLIGIEYVEAAATAQKTLRNELNVRIPGEQKLPAVDEQTIDGNWQTLTDTWIGDRQVADKQADTDAQNKQRRLKDLAEKGESTQDVDRAIHLYIDMKNNPKDYSAERIAKRTPVQRADIFRAKNLTPAQRALADLIIKENKALGLKGMEAGLLAAYHENYTARIWKFPKQKLGKRQAKFGTRTARAKPRTLGSILEGWERGFTLAVAGAVEAQQIARKQVAQVIHDRNLIALASKAKLIDTEQHADWKRIEHPNFKKWVYAGKVEEGKIYGRGVFLAPDGTVYRETPMYAEPRLARYLNNALGASRLYDIPGVGAITKYNSIIKQAILMTGLFHHQAFLRSYMLASRGINPVKAWQEGKEAAEEFGPELQLLVHEGLTYGLIQDFQLAINDEQTAVGKAIDKIAMAKDCKKLLIAIRDKQVKFLFGKMGPYLKVHAALIEYHARVNANEKKLVDGRITHREIAHAVAEELNNDFGGLNLPRMGRNPTAQHVFHLLALAPDWTESNIRSAIAAFRKGEIGAVHRLMWGRIALKGMGMVVLSNLMLAGFDDDDFWTRYRKAWKTGNLRWLDVDVTPIYRAMGGKDRKRKYFNLLGHFRDPIRFVVHPVRAAKGKSSVIGRMAWESLSGTDWSGRGFTSISDLATKGKVTEKRLFGKGPIHPKQIPSYLIWQGKQATPIQVQAFIDWQRGQIDGWDATMQSLGVAGGTTYPKKVKKLKRVSTRKRKRW